MAVSKQQKPILESAMTAPGAFRPKYIVEKTGLGYNIVSPQLDRLVAKKILVRDKEARTYTVSEEARKEWANPQKPPAATIPTPNTEQTTQPPSQAPRETTEPEAAEEKATKTQAATKVLTEESAGLSPYQHFKTLGLKIGVVSDIVDVVTDHVFNGGKYTDIKWVYRGLAEMAIRDDILKRWAGSWSSYLQKSMPAEQVEQLKQQAEQVEAELKTSETSKVVGDKDFIVEDGQVEYIGPGVGMFTANQAIQVAAITRRKNPTADALASIQKPMGPTELLDFFTKLQAMQKASAGTDQTVPSSFVVTMNPDGTSDIKEYKASGPIVIEKPQPAAKVQSFMLTPDGVVELEAGKPAVFQRPAAQQPEIWVVGSDGQLVKSEAGKPIILKQAPPADQGSRVILVKPTGELVEWDPKKPIVITREEPKGDFPMPISVVDEKGNPMRMDLNALITWKKYESEEKRADDRAKTLKDLIGTVREELPKMLQAAMLAFGSRSQPSAAQPASGAAAAQGKQPSLTCSGCGAIIGIKEGEPLPDTFNCPNCGAPVATKPESGRG